MNAMLPHKNLSFFLKKFIRIIILSLEDNPFLLLPYYYFEGFSTTFIIFVANKILMHKKSYVLVSLLFLRFAA